MFGFSFGIEIGGAGFETHRPSQLRLWGRQSKVQGLELRSRLLWRRSDRERIDDGFESAGVLRAARDWTKRRIVGATGGCVAMMGADLDRN